MTEILSFEAVPTVLVAVFAPMELAGNIQLLLFLFIQVLVHFEFRLPVAERWMISPAAKLPIVLEAIW